MRKKKKGKGREEDDDDDQSKRGGETGMENEDFLTYEELLEGGPRQVQWRRGRNGRGALVQ